MWSTTLPSGQKIKEFLFEQRRLDFSYAEVGHSFDRSPAGYNIDHNRAMLGRGRGTFEQACVALRAWTMFPAPWTRIDPANAPLVQGQVVAMLAHVYGGWWLNACRIVYTIDENGPVRRFGFAYGTLPGHVECGEERFSVEWLADDTVWYDLRAFSRPRFWLVKLAKPLARGLQRSFAVDSQLAMQRAVGGGGAV
ncbi:MAG TPA: DUF1990 domain-containing protein [Lacunisphaera sp.]|jgi:uncharacterized protein (UPF0548 family)